jgi:hypothetical protein
LKAGKVVLQRDRESSSEKPIEASITISWLEPKVGGLPNKISFRTIVSLKWADLLKHLPLVEGVSKNRVTILKMLSNAVAGQFRDAIERDGKSSVGQIRGRLDAASFDEIMQRLEGEGIINQVEGPKYVRQKSTYWTLTAKGAKRIREAHP